MDYLFIHLFIYLFFFFILLGFFSQFLSIPEYYQHINQIKYGYVHTK